MKKLTVIIFLLCFVRKAFNFEVNSCDDDEDKVLVATKSRSISIGCRTKSELSDCSISKVGSNEKCSAGKCKFGSLEIKGQNISRNYICQFELRNLDTSGVTIKIFISLLYEVFFVIIINLNCYHFALTYHECDMKIRYLWSACKGLMSL